MKDSLTVQVEELETVSDERILDILERSKDTAPITDRYFEAAIITCDMRPVMMARDWFETELTNLVENYPTPWSDPVWFKLVLAAARLIPGRDPKYRNIWLLLMGNKNYSTLAYGSLVRNEDECLDFLPIWWSVGPQDAERRLDNILSELFAKRDKKDLDNNTHSDERRRLRMKLERLAGCWPEDLSDAVARFLNHGRKEFARPVSQ